MNRTLFYTEVVVDGIKELDFLDHCLSNFETKRPTLYYRVHQNDHCVPDLIAFKTYQDESLWWVMLLANGVATPCDIETGDLLKVPNLADVYDFYKQFRKR